MKKYKNHKNMNYLVNLYFIEPNLSIKHFANGNICKNLKSFKSIECIEPTLSVQETLADSWLITMLNLVSGK
jgi:hypothetical protein